MSRPALFDALIRRLGTLFAVMAILLASRWLTELTAPRPVGKLPAAPAAPTDNGDRMIGRIFGIGETKPVATDGLLLTGMFATSKGGGFATFRTPGGAVSTFAGDEVMPGVLLKAVERDRVTVLVAGVPKELMLVVNSPASGQPPPALAAGQSVPQTAGQAPALAQQPAEAGSPVSRARKAANTKEED
jgi:hypothetical protein